MSEREPGNKIEKGSRRYREQIHRESKAADINKSLPFKFSKPTKYKVPNRSALCEKCGHESSCWENTIMIVCICGNSYRRKKG